MKPRRPSPGLASAARWSVACLALAYAGACLATPSPRPNQDDMLGGADDGPSSDAPLDGSGPTDDTRDEEGNGSAAMDPDGTGASNDGGAGTNTGGGGPTHNGDAMPDDGSAGMDGGGATTQDAGNATPDDVSADMDAGGEMQDATDGMPDDGSEEDAGGEMQDATNGTPDAGGEDSDAGDSEQDAGAEHQPARSSRQLAVNNTHSCVITSAGNVACWGVNRQKQLGPADLGGSDRSSEPVPIELESGELLSNVTHISAGLDFTCAVSNGVPHCWGEASFGRLGRPSEDLASPNPYPRPVMRDDGQGDYVPLSEVTEIASGKYHSCAISQETVPATLYCWGYNVSGQLGDNTKVHRAYAVPASKAADGTTAIHPKQVTAGSSHTCISRTVDHQVMCWGRNYEGQLGEGLAHSGSVAGPGTLVDFGTEEVVSIAAADDNTCVVLSSGVARCWGANAAGESSVGEPLEPDTSAVVLVPTTVQKQVAPGSYSDLTDVRTVSGGWTHTCFVTQADELYCAGNPTSARFGTPGSDPIRGAVLVADDVEMASLGNVHSCYTVAVPPSPSGTVVKCVGANFSQVGEVPSGAEGTFTTAYSD